MIGRIPEFYQDARENEDVFRAVLRDIKKRKGIVPKELDPEAKLDDILSTYSSEGERLGMFTILDFRVGPPYEDEFEALGQDEATITFQNLVSLSGRGATLVYDVNPEYPVDLKRVEDLIIR